MAAAALLLVVAAAVGSPIPDAPYQPFCNWRCEPASPACAPQQYGVAACNRTQTGGGCSVDGCQPWSQGAFPRILSDGRIINGGVPQAANLTHHLERLRAEIDSFIPDASWEMNGALDFEAWTPVWAQNGGGSVNWHGRVYQEYSINLTRQQHPHITNATEIEAIAAAEFEAAGINFFVRTLELLAELRPKVKWGFYGLPQGIWDDCDGRVAVDNCGFQSPTRGAELRARNDRLAAVWNASGALYPSVYLEPQNRQGWDRWRALQRVWVAGTVAETVRLVHAHAPGRPVKPFYWPMYHNATTAVDAEDVRMMIAAAFQPPLSTQLIVWDGMRGNSTAAALRGIDGPIFRQAVAEAAHCANTYCSGNGWCPTLVVGNITAPRACVCRDGFTGASCDRTTD